MIIRIASHRSMGKVKSILGGRPKEFTDMNYPKSHYFYEVTPEDFERIKHVKSVSRTRVQREELVECIGRGVKSLPKMLVHGIRRGGN